MMVVIFLASDCGGSSGGGGGSGDLGGGTNNPQPNNNPKPGLITFAQEDDLELTITVEDETGKPTQMAAYRVTESSSSFKRHKAI